jgi:ribonucleoside-diphosphate reductase alpha chain
MNRTAGAERLTGRATHRREARLPVGAGVAMDSAPAPDGDPIARIVPAEATGSHAGSQTPQEPFPTMIATRRTLPETRSSITHKFAVAGHEGYLTVGLHADGRPGEIFIKMSKAGSTLSGMCQAFTRAFSLAMQFGLSLDDACSRFKGMRFEPMGLTQNPEIPEASSIIDYVARYLELTFCRGEPG